MTGDEIDPRTMMYADESDLEVALRIRMLYRDQLDHEAVCTGARDRIMYLSQENERLTAEGKRKDAVIETAKALRDYCINNAGTPPAPLVCNLDDELNAVSGSPTP